MDISSRIKDLRKKHGLNQFELAEEIGISVDTVRRWESNKQVPRADELSNLASVLRITVDELLNGSDTQKWELKLVMKKSGQPQEGVIDMTNPKSNAALFIQDDMMAITLSAGYPLWEDDAEFEELIKDIRRKRAIGLKTRKEDW